MSVRLGMLLLGGALLVSACGDVAERVAERVVSEAVGADVDFDLDSGEASITTEDGSLVMGASLPEGFPSEVPVPDDAQVQSGYQMEQEGEGTYAAFLTTDQGFDAVVAFYKDRLAAGGWSLEDEQSMSSEGMNLVLLGATGHGYRVQVNIGAEDDGTAINLVVIPLASD